MRRDYKRIPEELRNVPHWVNYGKTNDRKGNPLKRPWNPNTGWAASVDNPRTWASFDDCQKAVGKGYCGLGFVFTGDYIVIDLDGVIDRKGNVHPIATEIIERVDSYTELSMSGRGFHIVANHSAMSIVDNMAELKMNPAQLRLYTRAGKVPQIEMYESGRYIALTGDVWQDRSEIRSAPEALEWVYKTHLQSNGTQGQARKKPAQNRPYTKPLGAEYGPYAHIKARMLRGENRDAIVRLWSGDISGQGGNASKAAVALCDHLAFYTDKDPAIMRALFMESGLYRQKCEEARKKKPTWLDLTIAKVLKKPMVTYSDYVKGHRIDSKAQ